MTVFRHLRALTLDLSVLHHSRSAPLRSMVLSGLWPEPQSVRCIDEKDLESLKKRRNVSVSTACAQVQFWWEEGIRGNCFTVAGYRKRVHVIG